MDDHRQMRHMDETNSAEADEPDARGAGGRSELIGVGGGDENVVKIQLAARWSELYAPSGDDTLEDALKRFKRVYSYIDAVTKLIDPDEA